MLETIGSIGDFIRAMGRIKGMEWMGELEREDIPPDDDFFAPDVKQKPKPDKLLSGRIFMIFTNQRALEEMLSLWARWKRNGELGRGWGVWKKLFERLKDVRTWGIQDRLLETGVLDDWRDRVAQGQERVRCEIELWYRQRPEQRQTNRDRVAALVEGLNGHVVTEASIEEICYHALLAELPIEAIRPLVEETWQDVDLVQCEQIQFVRASGQLSAVAPDGESEVDDAPLEGALEARGPPIVALLDGLPMQAHRRLEGRLIVDDPDGFESDYPAGNRRHGTAMASLILHGDLESGETALARPLYVRPVLRPDHRDWRGIRQRQETAPTDTLIVDLIHRAVRRLFRSEGGEPPAAAGVAVINFSIGIPDRPFEGSLSPLARLLDWLAWHHHVLFVVSAGNHLQDIEVAVTRDTAEELPKATLWNQVFRAVVSDSRRRRLLSPAEGVNLLTVGATDEDAVPNAQLPTRHGYAYSFPGLPSPFNAQGMGYRRGIKPELLAPGGRVAVERSDPSNPNSSLIIYGGPHPPGQAVAAPGRRPGSTDGKCYMRGTSNSAALVSRAAAMIYDVLDELRTHPGGEMIDRVPRSIWLKALLTHSADWGRAGAFAAETLRTAKNRHRFKDEVARFLGYGRIRLDRVRECTEYRATAIVGGELRSDFSHVHRFPLPPSLSGQRGFRRLTVTLGWLTPVNPRHHGWRRAHLWFEPPADRLRIKRKQADGRAVLRGTLQHEILEGDEATTFVDGPNLDIQVNCRADAGELNETVPYALVTTLEVAEALGIPAYEEIRERVRELVPIAPSD